jgi:polyisoprenoid-binding protein YceI
VNTTNQTAILTATGAKAPAPQTRWGFDASHSKLGFSISHFGISETEGRFTQFEGIILSDKEDFSDAEIDFNIDVASINTEYAQRDDHLRSPDFFDVAQFPFIHFKSRSLTVKGENRYLLYGDLTIHGITREIILEVQYRGTVVDPFNNTKAGFIVNGNIERNQYGLHWNGLLSGGGVLVGNTVHLSINIELIKN